MPGVAILFPGQGAQTVGMGRAVIEARPASRALFDQASAILGYDLLALCLEGPAERLNATDVSQPAIYVASLAALQQLEDTEPADVAACVATAGLSLGEYTALTFAGVLTFEDGLRLVQERGRAMQVAADANPGAMVSVLGMSPEELEQVLEQARPAGLVEIANLLCPGNVVISGERPAVEAAERIADGRGARCIRLAVAGAFHTGLMDPARPPLAAALARTPFHAPKLPIWSNVDGKPHSAADEIKGLLLEQVSRPVLWEQSMRALLDLGVDRFYEVGPGRVLAGLMKRIVRKADVRNIPA